MPIGASKSALLLNKFKPRMIFFGDENSSKYYTIAAHSSLYLPDADWAFGFWTRVEDNSGTAFQYLISNGGLGAASSINIYLSETDDTWSYRTEDDTGHDTFADDADVATGADNRDRLIVIQRETDDINIYFCEANRLPSLVNSVSEPDYAANTLAGTWYIGTRSDLSSTRFYESWFGGFWKADTSLSQEQIAAIARGVYPPDVIGANIKAYLAFSSADATVADEVGSNDATRVGSW